MRIRFSAAAFVCALAFFSMSQARAGTTVKSSKSNSSDREAAASTTGTPPVQPSEAVKSGKSNSSDRAIHGGVKDPTPAESTKVKSGKSNSSEKTSNLNLSKSNVDRKAAPTGSTGPESIKLNSSKSNADRVAISSASGVVASVDAKAKTLTLKRKDGSVVVLDASKLAGSLPKAGQSVDVKYVDVGGKPTARSIAVSDPGTPPSR